MSTSTHPVARRVVVITGAGGIGLACARRLGAGKQIVIGTFTESRLETAFKALRGEGFAVDGKVMDVRDKQSVTEFANYAASFGTIDSIVHTSGIMPVGETTQRIFDINILGTANVIDAFLEHATVGTSFVCISSVTAHSYPLPPDVVKHFATAPADKVLEKAPLDVIPQLAYMISKNAENVRVQAAAFAWKSRGARINSVSPGLVMTGKGHDLVADPMFGHHVKAMIEVAGRACTAQEVAGVAAFLSSDDAMYINGSDIILDAGGHAIGKWMGDGSWPSQ